MLVKERFESETLWLEMTKSALWLGHCVGQPVGGIGHKSWRGPQSSLIVSFDVSVLSSFSDCSLINRGGLEPAHLFSFHFMF